MVGELRGELGAGRLSRGHFAAQNTELDEVRCLPSTSDRFSDKSRCIPRVSRSLSLRSGRVMTACGTAFPSLAKVPIWFGNRLDSSSTTTTRMAPRHPTQLILEDPEYEEDIGDLSPYLSLPSSTSSRASSSTSFSGTSSPRTLPTDDEDIIAFHTRDAASPDALNTPTNTKFSFQLPSLSSPSVVSSPGRPLEISRANSLPDSTLAEKERSAPRQMREELKALSQDSVSIAKMRRWIMGIAVGKGFGCGYETPKLTFHIVEFDLDSGPVVEGIYPPLALTPAESQNMCVG